MTNSIEIEIAKSFDRESKRLMKKYKSLKTEITDLINKMQVDPFQGADLGGGVRKIRLPIESKGKGKRGGARVITHTDIVLQLMSGKITMLYIYDKSERSTISDKEIQKLLKEAGIK